MTDGRNADPMERSVGTWRQALPGLLLALSLSLASCGPDVEQVRVCERLIAAFEPPSAAAELLRAEADPETANAVRLTYRAADRSGRHAEHWIVCRFGGSGFDRDRLALVGVATDRRGALSGVAMHMLRFWLRLFDVQGRAAASQRPGPAEPAAARSLLYLLQQAVNMMAPGCIYGLLAIGYTLVYGIIGRINLAFGEMAMIGGYTTFLAVTVAALSGGSLLPFGLAGVLLLAMGIGALHGWATDRLVFRPLRGAASQAPLIATIGLAIALQEYVRLVQGSNDRWLQPVFTERATLAGGADFPVSVSLGQGIILLLTATLYAALLLLLRRTSFGRVHRACADDPRMAALLGVDVERTVALAFALGAAYAAAGGFIITLHYGTVGFFMGHLIGFKALTAAVVGGIGSVPGAMLGGALIAAIETFWSGYATLAYKDVAVFSLLAAVLIFRPQGLLGQPAGRGD